MQFRKCRYLLLINEEIKEREEDRIINKMFNGVVYYYSIKTIHHRKLILHLNIFIRILLIIGK